MATRLEIKAKTARIGTEGKVKGPITAVDALAGTFDVLGVSVILDGETKLEGDRTLKDLALGDVVDVKGAFADGQLHAAKIKVKTPEIEGTVESVDRDGVDAATIVVLGRRVEVTSLTDVRREMPKSERGERDEEKSHDGRGD